MTKCPYENLEELGIMHLDPFGNAHICQGLSIGNFWEIPLSNLIEKCTVDLHPICGTLIRGSSAQFRVRTL